VGSGRSTLAQTIFGILPANRGKIALDGRELSIRSAGDAIAEGIYLVPEDRKKSGLCLTWRYPRTSAGRPASYTRLQMINGAAERRVAEEQRKKLGIKTPSVETIVVTLSGGNQQKVVLAKWLSMRPNLLIFDEPTRGIDVGAKSEIYSVMRGLADAGVAILMISSDMEEVIGVSDRIAVMHEGQISGILDRSEFTEHQRVDARRRQQVKAKKRSVPCRRKISACSS
jgi:ribose transport system ATP-binding protein